MNLFAKLCKPPSTAVWIAMLAGMIVAVGVANGWW